MSYKSPSSLDKKREWIRHHRSEWLKDYFDFLKFPTISAEAAPTTSHARLHAVAESFLKNLGFSVEEWPTENGAPVLFASHLKAGRDKPTLLIYNHYDVQPVDPLEEWLSPPFEPTQRGDNIYARGAQDNKGQCLYVLQALKLLLDQTGELPINVKLCIEGGEEIGSNALSQLIPSKERGIKS